MTVNISKSHTAFEFPYVVSDNQFKTSAILNLILGGVSLLVFIALRGTLRSVGGVYQRRRELADLFLQAPPLLLCGLHQAWSWVTTVMCMSDTAIVRTAGFDALLLNRTILMGLQIFSVLTLLALGILLPTYYSFDDVVTHRLHRGTNVAELSRTTISNLPPGHAILWLPTVATYLVTAYCCWVLLVHCQSYAELRMAYMLCLDAAGAEQYQEKREVRPVRRPHEGSVGLGPGRLCDGNPSGSFQERNGMIRSDSSRPTNSFAAAPAATSPVASARGSLVSLHYLLPVEATMAAQPQVPGSASLGGPDLGGQATGDCSSPARSHLARMTGLHNHELQGLTPDGLRSNLSNGSLQAAAAAGLQVAVSVGPAAHRASGLVLFPYDTTSAAATVGTASAMEAGRPAATPAPHVPRSMSLRVRLRLVAPWLRHVVVRAAERAARHKAADNLLAWVNPLKMLAKDREDWARQQLAADADPDPSLPPLPSGCPPPATAAYAGLLVASEDMLMALTGRGEEVTEPHSRSPCFRRAPRVHWSESVRELAKSLGILLWPDCGLNAESSLGEKVSQARSRANSSLRGAAGRQEETGRGEHATCSHPVALGSSGEHHKGSAFTAKPMVGAKAAVTTAQKVFHGGGGGGTMGIQSHGTGMAGQTGQDAANLRKAVGVGTGGSLRGYGSKSHQAPPVYRYWAPAAEQRCFCRDLRRRQRRQVPWQQPPGTPLGFDTVSNPVFELSTAPTATCSAAGSISGGGGCKVTAAVGMNQSIGTALLRSRVQGAPAVVLNEGSLDGGGATPAEVGEEEEEEDDDDDEDDDEDEFEAGETGRPWTGWQQQPLVVGRCNARLRQLMKVRHGGRSHLVNCHHYAVLVRDVVLRPMERFNAIGLPVVRSAVEECDPLCTGDVELGRAIGGGAGSISATVGAALSVVNPQSVSVKHARRCSSSGGSSSSDYDGNDRRGGRRRARRYGPEIGSTVLGTLSSDENGSGSEGGEDSKSEHNPLLTGNDGSDGGEGSGGGLARAPQHHRLLLQPTSDLPIRDRAARMIHELRNHRKRNRHRRTLPIPTPRDGDGGVAAETACAAMRPSDGHVGARTVAVELSPACARGVRDADGGCSGEADDGPNRCDNGTPLLSVTTSPYRISRRANSAIVSLQAGPPSPRERAGREAGQGAEEPRCPSHEPVSGPGVASCGVASAIGLDDLSGVGSNGRHGVPTAVAAAPERSSCIGSVPAPLPLMEVPYDDSEEAAAVAAYYTQLFPDSFQRLVPVCNHRAVDELLFQWTTAMGNLQAALLAAHVAVRSTAMASRASTVAVAAASLSSSPSSPAASAATRLRSVAAAAALAALTRAPAMPASSGQPLAAPPDLPPPGSAHVAAIRRAAGAVRQLQDRIVIERARALRNPTRRAYIALFSSQRDAAAAAQCSPLAPPSRAQPLHFRACAAPPPDSVYWPALWTLPTGRAARLLASLPLLAVVVFPIGVLTGALANLPVAVCGGSAELNALYWPWFCNRQQSHSMYARLAKSLFTGLLPALISLGWNAWVLPMVLYLLSAIQSRCVSLPAMDRQMSRWFFWWSLLNMFLGAVVGGGIFQQLGAYLQNPGMLLLRIGTALPTTSNFFMHYTLTKGLYSNWLRVAWPHLGSMAGAILRSLAGAGLPRSWQDAFLIHSPPGYRFSSFYNGIFQTLMVGLAYVVTAPLIAPIALLFFLTAYITWRYAIVYIYERQYESGGQMFPVVFSHMTGYLLVAELFTGAVLLTNGAWIQATLLWCSITPGLVAFHRLCVRRYLGPLEHSPLSLAMASPPASVDPAVYMPPALREGAVGWYPESGKVWEQYGIPKYVI
ncbi:hypothetical protein VaNZ11_004347 [Volvox africanus]|uniref:CSC1/OSCA1-like 7TM region domain-containing protein n=1 Tax=Volvox africanus TaxID=51714 RepID=A0ABQ5RW38_9CHLO|nr:hypothetical protein VaNZ11_004347 [Volvox africanus]